MKKFFVIISMCAVLLVSATSCSKADEPVIYDEVKSVVDDLGHLYVQGHDLVGMWVVTGTYDEESDSYTAAPSFGQIIVIRSNQTIELYFYGSEIEWLHNGVAKGLDLTTLDSWKIGDFLLYDNYTVKLDESLVSIVVDRADRVRYRTDEGFWVVCEKIESVMK